MRAAILGWGSLTYNWEGLTLREPVTWVAEGPTLPIEFSRISRGGRLTAVVDERNGEWVRTAFAESALQSVEAIVEELRIREGPTKNHWIGRIDTVTPTEWSRSSPAVVEHIRKWLAKSGFQAAVWTEVPADFGEASFTLAAAIEHLTHLPDNDRVAACNYIAWAPPFVDTPLRRVLEKREMLDRNWNCSCTWRPPRRQSRPG